MPEIPMIGMLSKDRPSLRQRGIAREIFDKEGSFLAGSFASAGEGVPPPVVAPPPKGTGKHVLIAGIIGTIEHNNT